MHIHRSEMIKDKNLIVGQSVYFGLIQHFVGNLYCLQI